MEKEAGDEEKRLSLAEREEKWRGDKTA